MVRRPKRKIGFGDVKIARPELAPYGLRDGDVVEACPVPPGAKRRITVCQKLGRPSAQVATPRDVCAVMRGAALADRESLYALDLNQKNQIVAVEEVAKGTIAQVETSPREFMKGRILNNAAAFIMVHNHPSGSVEPSGADIELTRYFANIGREIGIPMRDHIIIAPAQEGGTMGCNSLRDTSHTRGIPFGDAGGRKKKRKRARRRR